MALEMTIPDIHRPFSFFDGLFTADPVFVEPGFEGRVFGGGGGVATTAGVANAEELFLDGRAAVEVVFNAHVVAGAKPAVGIAVEEDAARFLPVVGTGRVPDTTVKKYG